MNWTTSVKRKEELRISSWNIQHWIDKARGEWCEVKLGYTFGKDGGWRDAHVQVTSAGLSTFAPDKQKDWLRVVYSEINSRNTTDKIFRLVFFQDLSKFKVKVSMQSNREHFQVIKHRNFGIRQAGLDQELLTVNGM